MERQWVGIDADDTLWHSETYFTESYDLFAHIVAPHLHNEPDPLTASHKALIATERQNIPSFGYGVKGATLSMIESAIENTNGNVTIDEITALIQRAKFMLAHPVELIDGTIEMLESLSHHRLIMITKGDLVDQHRKIDESELASRFDAIEVVSEKDPTTYLSVLARHDIAPKDFVMIGNSIRSDVLPVLEIGSAAVHLPYSTTWEIEEVVEDVCHPRFVSTDERNAMSSVVDTLFG